MDKNYFETLANSIKESNNTDNRRSSHSDTAFLTVKVDIDCKMYCDGDFLDLVEANKVKKIPIEVGQHLITIESENVEGVSEDREVSAQEAGKNYLLVFNGMENRIQEKMKLNDELIDRICSREGLSALFHGSYVLGEDQDEPPFTFEPLDWDRTNGWDDAILDSLLKGKSIVVFKVASYPQLDQFGLEVKAKHLSINGDDPIMCHVYIISLNHIRDGVQQTIKTNKDAIVLIKSFVDNIDFYNSCEWIYQGADNIPQSVFCILESALVRCDKNEALLYIKNH